MPVSLRQHLYCCTIDDRVIILDLRKDRYFLVDAQTSAALNNALSAAEEPSNHEMTDLQRLVSRGFLVPRLPMAGPDKPLQIKLPTAEYEKSNANKVSPAKFATALFWQARTAISLRQTPLFKIIQKLKAVNIQQTSTSVSNEMGAILRAFSASDRIISAHERCLLKAIALVRALAAAQIPSKLVFGVRLYPFCAHAWVQQGDRLLNDTCDRVRNYTPILAV